MKEYGEKSMHNLARLAKLRMLNGYYDAPLKNDVYNRSLKKCFYDKVMYDKIVQILTTTEYCSDAIGRLSDKDIIAFADDATKQRHILEISSNYLKVRDELRKKKIIS